MASQCNAGLQGAPGAATCLDCLGEQAPYSCLAELYTCAACAGEEWYENYGPAFSEGFFSKAREDQFSCTNGGNVWYNGCFWTNLDWEAQYCDLSCWSGWDEKPVTVAADCAGPPDGPISCTCTVGKNAGQTFELPDCTELIWYEALWDPCNL